MLSFLNTQNNTVKDEPSIKQRKMLEAYNTDKELASAAKSLLKLKDKFVKVRPDTPGPHIRLEP